MSLLQNSNAISAGGYDINNSLRFRSSASAYLNRTPGTAGNRKTWTWSAWIKLGTISVNMGTLFGVQGQTAIYLNDGTYSSFRVNGAAGSDLITNLMPRDPAAWYHLVVACDTTQATEANRLKIYVNGVQQTSFQAGSAYPTLNGDTFVNSTALHTIGRRSWNSDQQFDGYIAEQYLIDGSAKTPSDFGETDTTTGVWKPKAYTGTYGTNGYYLKFSDIATTSGSNAGLGKDFSGNTNYWTTNNISVTAGTTYDAMIDSPTLTSATVANYAVLNPVYKSASQPTISNGNLTVAPSAVAYQNAFSSIGVTSGKWYCEILVTGTPNSANMIGVANATQLNYLTGTTSYIGNSTGVGYGYFIFNGQKYTNNAGTSYGNTIASGDIVGIALDLNNGKIWFSKNGTWQASGDPAAGTNAAFTGIASDTWFIGSTSYSGGSTSFNHNFGQRPFSYTPPTGFVRLNTYNLPDSTIKKGNSYMDATTYTGNNASRSITNTGSFKPDFVWVKDRSRLSSNDLVDSVRGVNKALISDATTSEYTGSFISSFNSTGFSLPANTTSDSFYTNISGDSFVAWQWQAGQGSTSSNTSGSITSTVSVNTTAGFSIVTYTGTGANATVGHGLGVAPKMLITKRRNTTGDWSIYNSNLGTNKVIWLNQTTASTTDGSPGHWNNTAPTSSVFTVGTDTDVNASSSTYVAYCWAEIAGFSKFGSYTGNSSTDGPFVYTGFRPKFIMIKRTDTTSDWHIHDAARNTYNVTNNTLYPSGNYAEDVNHTAVMFDFTANGFKVRASHPTSNNNGSSHIYMVFAESPFKTSLAR
jgi:hypothetical protein